MVTDLKPVMDVSTSTLVPATDAFGDEPLIEEKAEYSTVDGLAEVAGLLSLPI